MKLDLSDPSVQAELRRVVAALVSTGAVRLPEPGMSEGRLKYATYGNYHVPSGRPPGRPRKNSIK